MFTNILKIELGILGDWNFLRNLKISFFTINAVEFDLFAVQQQDYEGEIRVALDSEVECGAFCSWTFPEEYTTFPKHEI